MRSAKRSISVVMPVRNGGDLLRAALRSARIALGPGDEIIVVDNESSDDTPAVASEFADFVIAKSGSVGACRFAGVKASSGELIFFLDADQLLSPETLASAVAVLERESACAVLVPERPVRTKRQWLARLLSAERALTEAVGAGIPRLITREAYDEIFFAEPQLVFAEDWPLTRPSGKVAASDVPVLHVEPESIGVLLAKYFRYGQRAAAVPANTVGTFGIGRRLLLLVRASGGIDRTQCAWLLPVLGLKVGKYIALMLGYLLGRVSTPVTLARSQRIER